MKNKDLIRSEIFNTKFGYTKYKWVKEFVYSNLLEQDVALAKEKGNKGIILIDVFGEPIDY